MVVRSGRSDAYVTAFIFVVFVAVIVVFVLARRAVTSPPPASQPAPAIPAAVRPSLPAEAEAPTETESAVDGGFIGVILARESVDVAAEIEGRLTEVCCQLGDSVRKDRAVALLDDTLIRQEIAIAAEVRHRLQVELERGEVILTEAQSFYEREKHLFDMEQTSRTAYERAQRVRDVAEKDLEVALANLAEQDARIRQLRKQHDATTVVAPFDGVVAARYQDVGAVVSAGTPIVRLASVERIVRFAAEENEAPPLGKGQRVRVRVEGLTDRLNGTVRRISPEVDSASGMVVIESSLRISESVQEYVKSGMVASVFLDKSGAATLDNQSEGDKGNSDREHHAGIGGD